MPREFNCDKCHCNQGIDSDGFVDCELSDHPMERTTFVPGWRYEQCPLRIEEKKKSALSNPLAQLARCARDLGTANPKDLASIEEKLGILEKSVY